MIQRSDPAKNVTRPGSHGRGPDPARLAAVRVLHAVYEQGAYANLSARRLLDEDRLDARDRRFAAALIYETLSRTWTIDYLLRQVSRKPLETLDPWIRTVLRLGVWQLYWSHSIPASAAIDESVRIAALRAHRTAAGFVNALLRRLAREPVPIPENNMPLQTGIPAELYGLLRKWYGDAMAESIARSALDHDGKVTARVNRHKTTPAALAERLQAAGFECVPGRYCPSALQLSLQGHPVRSLPGWTEGCLSIQDEAAMLVGHVAGSQAGHLVVDLCAAPGGKTLHIAEISLSQARIIAVDHHPDRLGLIREQAARLGLTGITCLAADSSTGLDLNGHPAFAGLLGQADLVLADVPCSGLGLLARKPEIRLTMTYERIQTFIPLQAAILNVAAALVKPGGRLIYSTCTINPAENGMQIDAFLAHHAGHFAPASLLDRLPESLLDDPDLKTQAACGRIQLLAHRQNTDGFFIAELVRTQTSEAAASLANSRDRRGEQP